MTTKTAAPETIMPGAKLSGSDARIEGSTAFNVIGGNCQTAKNCCTQMETDVRNCFGGTLPPAWDTLKESLNDCVVACETGAAHFGVRYEPAPTVFAPT